MSSSSEIYTDTFIHNKHVTVIGGGVLGRRLCLMWCSTGKPVFLFDTSEKQAEEAKRFVDENVEKQMQKMNASSRGEMSISTNLETAVKDAWMVIEAIPEILELKIEIFGKLDKLTDSTCILVTNSSSIKSSQIIGNVEHKNRVLNTHYYMPPASACVELMSCGYTDPRIIPFVSQQCESVGFKACEVKKQSTGLIYNRVWAAIKRECLDVLAEGVAEPEDIDVLFKDWFHAEKGPCQMMDEVGLDTVYNIEKVYISDRGLSGESNEWLKREYVDKGKLGNKSGGNGLLGTQKRE